jgi:hypothetical protein
MSLGFLPQERVIIFFVSRLFCGQSRKLAAWASTHGEAATY